jgi:hypothetical protein
MEIKGKVHCFFEQSGTFKNEFKKLGFEAFDYDIQNNFGETDHIVDLFAEIENAYDGLQSLFDSISRDDLILAFFPCINFCDAKTMMFKGVSIFQKKWSLDKIMDENIKFAKEREYFFELLMKLVSICAKRGLRLVIENPWNDSGETYLQRNFIKPTIIDKNRTLRGDIFVKPTAYWFINCENTTGFTLQKDKEVKIVYKAKDKHKVEAGTCSEARSMIHPDYARNFICDFILGKEQETSQLTLFEL